MIWPIYRQIADLDSSSPPFSHKDYHLSLTWLPARSRHHADIIRLMRTEPMPPGPVGGGDGKRLIVLKINRKAQLLGKQSENPVFGEFAG